MGHRRVDFLILGRQLIFVEIDGSQHYNNPKRTQADRQRDSEIYPILGENSLSLRLTNRMVSDGTAEQTLQSSVPIQGEAIPRVGAQSSRLSRGRPLILQTLKERVRQ